MTTVVIIIVNISYTAVLTCCSVANRLACSQAPAGEFWSHVASAVRFYIITADTPLSVLNACAVAA